MASAWAAAMAKTWAPSSGAPPPRPAWVVGPPPPRVRPPPGPPPPRPPPPPPLHLPAVVPPCKLCALSSGNLHGHSGSHEAPLPALLAWSEAVGTGFVEADARDAEQVAIAKAKKLARFKQKPFSSNAPTVAAARKAFKAAEKKYDAEYKKYLAKEHDFLKAVPRGSFFLAAGMKDQAATHTLEMKERGETHAKLDKATGTKVTIVNLSSNLTSIDSHKKTVKRHESLNRTYRTKLAAISFSAAAATSIHYTTLIEHYTNAIADAKKQIVTLQDSSDNNIDSCRLDTIMQRSIILIGRVALLGSLKAGAASWTVEHDELVRYCDAKRASGRKRRRGRDAPSSSSSSSASGSAPKQQRLDDEADDSSDSDSSDSDDDGISWTANAKSRDINNRDYYTRPGNKAPVWRAAPVAAWKAAAALKVRVEKYKKEKEANKAERTKKNAAKKERKRLRQEAVAKIMAASAAAAAAKKKP